MVSRRMCRTPSYMTELIKNRYTRLLLVDVQRTRSISIFERRAVLIDTIERSMSTLILSKQKFVHILNSVIVIYVSALLLPLVYLLKLILIAHVQNPSSGSGTPALCYILNSNAAQGNQTFFCNGQIDNATVPY